MKISKINLIISGLAILLFILLGYLVFALQKNSPKEINCPSDSGKYECWREALNETLEEDGLAASFEVLARLYDTEPAFTSECHSFTHDLGKQAYNLFSQNKEIEMTPKASYCGYGFYHGFIETLLHSGADIKEAEDFCSYADAQLSNYGEKVSIACYHGIGHGAVDGSDPRNWGDPQKLIAPGLDICRTISILPDQIHQCGTGVFNSLAIALNNNLYNLAPVKHPYEVCLSQSDEFIKSCYEQMNSLASNLSKGNFYVASGFVMDIPNEEYAISAMEQLAPAMIAAKVGRGNDFKEELEVCKSLPEHLKNSCINGLVGGIIEFGKPDFEYIEAMDFCDSAELTETEKKDCFGRVVSNASIVYSVSKTKEVCNMIDVKYELDCK